MSSMNGQPQSATDGQKVFPVDEFVTAGLTEKQISYVRHLQRGNALYDDGYTSGHEDISEAISALQKCGYDIETTKEGSRRGKEVFSHRMRGTAPKVGQKHGPAPLPDLLSLASKPIEPTPEPQAPMPQRRRKYTRRSPSYDIVKGHLASKRTISPREALELYGLTIGSLTAVISRLRNEDQWRIASVPPAKGHEEERTSYRLEDTQQTPKIHAADTDFKSANAFRFADGVSVKVGSDGPEIEIVCDNMPFRLRPDHLQLLSVNLNHFAGAARKA